MISLSMIVKGTEAEADVLARCLKETAPHVDTINLTFTYKPGQAVHEKCYQVAKFFSAQVTEFEWTNDFAAARNYNFSQATGDYILWLDADDVPRGIEKLRATIEAHPEVDVFSMFYLYAFDERNNPTVVHHKTRVIKNDGCVEWAGRLHEDFKENRTLTRFHIKGIDILHLSTDDRYDSAKERNLEVARAQVLSEPNDARSYWNLANALFACGKFDDSLEAYDTFLNRSTSDDEKYLVRQRRAEVYWSKGELQKALDEARYAIGTKPEYPDAYHLAGKLYYEMGRYELAKDMFLNGLGRPVPYYQIIVYNPRDYDYVPLMMLAKTYYALNLPQLALPALEAAGKIVPHDASLKKVVRQLKKEAKEGNEVLEHVAKMRKVAEKGDTEKLQKLLDKVPDKFKYHPEVLRIKNTNFVKTESSGKDLVVFCGHTEEPWTPATVAKKGSGGSEEAIIKLTEGLAAKGWNVTVYNNCGTEEYQYSTGFQDIQVRAYDDSTDIGNPETEEALITYKPYLAWNYRDKQDVTIIWRNPGMCKYPINSTKIYVDMHDVIPSGEFTPDRVERITKVFFKSKWHRELFPNVPDEKAHVLPNGIVPEMFAVGNKDPWLMINTASPVRSLSALIEIMKLVRQEVPQAKMQWAYGWTTTDFGLSQDPKYPEWKARILKGMEEAGIEDLGRLNHKQVAELYNRASLYVYPTGFPEIDCISISKALAAGCVPITTDYGAIKEKAGHGGEFINYPDNHEQPGQIDYAVQDPAVIQVFADKIVEHLKNPQQADRQWALDTYAWDRIINEWDKELNG